MIAHRKPLIPLRFPPAIALGKLSGGFRGSSDTDWNQTDTDVLESEGSTGGTLSPDYVTSSGRSWRWLSDRTLRIKGFGGAGRLAESASRPATKLMILAVESRRGSVRPTRWTTPQHPENLLG